MYPGTVRGRSIASQETEVLSFKTKDEPTSIAACTIPAVNIGETPEAYQLMLAAPGLQRDDFSIVVKDATLTIAAQRDQYPDTTVPDRCEYDYGCWTRAFRLPADADVLLATATYRNGELIIFIPKDNTAANTEQAVIYVY